MSKQTDLLMERVSITGETQTDRVLNHIELYERERGQSFSFHELVDTLAKNGIKLGGSSWYAIKDPEYRYSLIPLLSAVSLFFGDDPDFLIPEQVEPSDRYKASLEEITNVAAMETARLFVKQVRRFSDDVLVNKVLTNVDELLREERGFTLEVIWLW